MPPHGNPAGDSLGPLALQVSGKLPRPPQWRCPRSLARSNGLRNERTTSRSGRQTYHNTRYICSNTIASCTWACAGLRADEYTADAAASRGRTVRRGVQDGGAGAGSGDCAGGVGALRRGPKRFSTCMSDDQRSNSIVSWTLPSLSSQAANPRIRRAARSAQIAIVRLQSGTPTTSTSTSVTRDMTALAANGGSCELLTAPDDMPYSGSVFELFKICHLYCSRLRLMMRPQGWGDAFWRHAREAYRRAGYMLLVFYDSARHDWSGWMGPDRADPRPDTDSVDTWLAALDHPDRASAGRYWRDWPGGYPWAWSQAAPVPATARTAGE